MRTRQAGRSARGRSGLAATELALALPVLAFLFQITADFSRLFFALATLSDSARAGAMYYATTSTATTSSIQAVALADATNLSPTPTVTSTAGTDSAGNSTVTVTVSYPFSTLTSITGVASPATLSRSVTMMPNPP